jgi:hypothetical protein
MGGLRRRLWGTEHLELVGGNECGSGEERRGEMRDEKELAAWIPAWILCCNTFVFPSCVCLISYNSFSIYSSIIPTCFLLCYFLGTF